MADHPIRVTVNEGDARNEWRWDGHGWVRRNPGQPQPKRKVGRTAEERAKLGLPPKTAR